LITISKTSLFPFKNNQQIHCFSVYFRYVNAQPVILFDGVCNLCNGVVKLVIRQDAKGYFKLAALQSTAGQMLLQKHGLPQKEFETFLLIENGKVYQQSDAALKVARQFKWHWQWLQILWLAPRPLRNAVYRFIALNRYHWFGKKEACMIPTPDIQQRFLND